MSREIKFRCYDPNLKEVYKLDCCSFGCPNEDKELIIMQYTGLKDKNGAEIYEGDILTRNNKVGIINVEVRFNDDRASFELHKRYYNINYDFDCDNILDFDLKVIGNIYENKEIL